MAIASIPIGAAVPLYVVATASAPATTVDVTEGTLEL
jgi:hypothetical protein